MSKTALIIGVGIGGLTTAIHLARQGFQVKILEKNSYAGGRCGQIVRDGYYFDTGPTFLILPDLYRQMFQSFGENLDDWVTLLPVDPLEQIIFTDNQTITLTRDLNQMKNQLESIEKGSFKQLISFIQQAKKLYDFALDKILTRDIQSLSEYASIANLFDLINTKAIINHQRFMSRYFQNEKLRAAFSFHDTYIGLNPYSAPSIFALFAYAEFTDGVWLPKGGMHSVTEALVKIAQKYNVEITYDAEVDEIITNGGKVDKVHATNGQDYSADVMVINADLPYIYRKLLTPNSTDKKLQKKKYACSTITYMWGLSEKHPMLQTHNLFLNDPINDNFHKIVEEQQTPVNPHFYIHAPSRTDITMAPENKDTLTVIVPVGNLQYQEKVNWEEKVDITRDFIIRRLEKYGLKNINSKIKFEMTIDPRHWHQEYNLTYGTTLGLHHNFRQLAYFRPKRQDAKYSNLFFVGSNTHPGSGVPTVMLSALFTSQLIQKNDIKD